MSPSHVTRVALGALGVALVLGGGGCSSSPTAPPSLSDPLTTAAQAAALDSAFTPPLVATFQTLDTALHAAWRASPSTDQYTRLVANVRTLRLLVPSFAALGPSGIFPDSLLGSVYSWDTTSSAYVRSAKTGGPTTGIRFLLDSISPYTDKPATPLKQVGYADFLDKSAGGTASLEIQISDGTTTYLDYTFSGSGTSTSFNASVVGTITNGVSGTGNRTLGFNVTIQGTSASATLTSTYTLNNPAVSAQETATVADDGTTTTLTLGFTLSRSAEAVGVKGTVTVADASGVGSVNLTFTVNGATFATITGAATNPTITKAGGGQLTAGELAALEQLLLTAGDINDKLGQLFFPAEHAFGL
jgi:hypothetical protein